MNEVRVARQPIFDRRLEVVGYELLFRAGDATTALVADSEGATATVVLNSFTELGLERVVGRDRRGSTSPGNSCSAGSRRRCRRTWSLLEILEDQLIDEELVAAITELKQQRPSARARRLPLHPERRAAAAARRRRQARSAGARTGGAGAARSRGCGRTGSRCWPRSSRPKRISPTASTPAATCSRGTSSAGPSSSRAAGSTPTGCRCCDCWPRFRTRRSSCLIWSGRSRSTSDSATACCATSTPRSSGCARRSARSARRWRCWAWRGSSSGQRSPSSPASKQARGAELTALIRARFCELAASTTAARTPASCSRSACSRSSTRSWTSRWPRYWSASRFRGTCVWR